MFCDLSTPKTGATGAKAAKTAGGNLDSPELHALEAVIGQDEDVYKRQGENSFGYLATWAKDRELTELRTSLETINRTSRCV